MNKFHKLAAITALSLTAAFTYTCSSGGGGNDDPPPSSSSAGGTSSGGGSSSGGSSSSAGGSSSSVDDTPKCGGEAYNTSTQFCNANTIYTKCGNTLEYSPATEQCCGSSKYATATHYCFKNTIQEYLFDSRDDNKKYKTIVIGEQTWMAENLNYETETGSACYDNDEDNCATYGRLYNWATAMDGAPTSSANPSGVQGVCPDGWHLPSDAEWTELALYVGGTGTYGEIGAGTKLKSDSDLWWTSATAGTDEFGFAGLPGGSGNSSGSFSNVGLRGLWWSATESDASNAYRRYMYYGGEIVDRLINDKTTLYSVRCVQD